MSCHVERRVEQTSKMIDHLEAIMSFWSEIPNDAREYIGAMASDEEDLFNWVAHWGSLKNVEQMHGLRFEGYVC